MKNKKNRNIIIIISLVIIFSVGYFVFYKESNTGNFSSLDLLVGQEEVEQYEVKIEENSSPVYIHDNPSFSFNYPEDFTTSNFPERSGEIILIQRVDENVGLQVFITAFDESPSSLTPERVGREIPGLVMVDARSILFNGEPSGVTFVNKTNLEATREVWFARGGFLFQVTTTASFQEALKQIMNTWKFEQ